MTTTTADVNALHQEVRHALRDLTFYNPVDACPGLQVHTDHVSNTVRVRYRGPRGRPTFPAYASEVLRARGFSVTPAGVGRWATVRRS